jgi:hypothetical protein
MTITRAQLEGVLVSRRRAYIAQAGLSVVITGANADFADPIGYAIRKCGGSVADIANPADGDLASVSTDDLDKLLDYAEYRLLHNIKGAWAQVDISIGQQSENLSQFAAQLDLDIAKMKETIQSEYGGGGNQLTAGLVTMNFASKADDETLWD